MKKIFKAIVVILCISIPMVALAHTLGESYIFLRVFDNKIDGHLELDVRDLDAALSLSLPEDVIVSKDDVAPYADSIRTYILERLSFTSPYGTHNITFTDFDVVRHHKIDYAMLYFELQDVAAKPEYLDVTYSALFETDPDHKGLVVIEYHWDNGIFRGDTGVATMTPGNFTQRVDLTGTSFFSGLVSVVVLGIEHIWEGIDHILFIVALIIPAVMRREENQWAPAPDFRSAFWHVLKIITLFTLAHSVTLSLAALGILDLPSRLVESIIAFSIIVAAVEIVYPIFKERIGWLVFGFGLFHGFGFASVLSQLGVTGEHLVASLLGFNLGVEIGQVVIICLLFPLLFFIRNFTFYPKVVMRTAAVALIGIAMIWFIERAFDLDITIQKFLAISGV